MLILISRVLFFNRLFIYALHLHVRSFPFMKLPYQNLGFILAEFTSFHSFFQKTLFLWHFMTYQPCLTVYVLGLSLAKLPAFIRCSTNTTIITDCGCPDFPLFLAIGSHEHNYFTQKHIKKQSLFIFINFFFQI